MFTLLPLVAAAAILVTLFAVLTAHTGALNPAVVDPFAPASPATDPSADTISGGGSLVRTAFAPPSAAGATGWQVATLSSLSDVEDLLDSLEVHGVRDREVVTVTDDQFAVRWK